MFVVIKVERVSDDDIVEGYVFPNENDDLTGYAGGSTHLMVPSGLLQDISKYDYTILVMRLKHYIHM